MERIPKNSYIVTNDPALTGFFNEVKEAVKEYKPKTPLDVIQPNHEASHFSPTTRSKTEWLMAKTTKINNHKKKKGFKKKSDRLEDLIKQSHKTVVIIIICQLQL